MLVSFGPSAGKFHLEQLEVIATNCLWFTEYFDVDTKNAFNANSNMASQF